MISTDQAKIEFSSGLSSGAILPFTLRFFEKDDLQVWVTSGGVATLLSPTVEYSIADSSSYEHGANVTLLTAPPNGAIVTIKRVLPVKQGLELPNHGKLPTESLETQLDHIVMVQQQHAEELDRAFKVPIGGSASQTQGQTDYAHFAEYAGYANAAGSAGVAGMAQSIDGGYVVNSAGHATAAAGLDAGVIVDSAGHATKAAGLDQGVVVASATHATAAAGLDAGVVVASASSAGYASSAGKAPASGGTASYASSAGKAPASGGTATSATYASYLGGATKQQIIDSAVESGGGGGGGAFIAPNYLNFNAGNSSVYPHLSAGVVYETSNNGYLRISVYNEGVTYSGCCRMTVYIPNSTDPDSPPTGYNSVEMGLYQFASGTSGGGVTIPYPMSSGWRFMVSSPPTGASVLIMYDHPVTSVGQD